MGEAAKGLWAMIAACVIWGLSPIYFKALGDVPAFEVLCHRIVWSLVFFLIVLRLQGRVDAIWQAIRGRTGRMVGFASVAAGINWLTFIWAIQSGQTVEVSLGYYVYPLLAILLGMFVFGERLTPAQAIAAGLAGLGVAVLTAGLGRMPWVGLGVALSFAFYGMAKKGLALPAMVTVTAEVVFLAPLAVIWLAGVHLDGWPGGVGAFGDDPLTTVLLIAAGPLTGGPLMLFSYAVQRVRLTTIGLVQYLSPTMQFLCAVLLLGEVLTPWHMIAFPLIWAALAIYSAASLRQSKAAAKDASSVATSGTAAR